MNKSDCICELKWVRGVYSGMRKEYGSCVEALGMAINALEQTAWIPTRDRKPAKAGQYLVTKQQKTGELQRATAHYNPTFDEWSGNGNFGKVLAWMELPAPYKEDTND